VPDEIYIGCVAVDEDASVINKKYVPADKLVAE